MFGFDIQTLPVLIRSSLAAKLEAIAYQSGNKVSVQAGFIVRSAFFFSEDNQDDTSGAMREAISYLLFLGWLMVRGAFQRLVGQPARAVKYGRRKGKIGPFAKTEMPATETLDTILVRLPQERIERLTITAQAHNATAAEVAGYYLAAELDLYEEKAAE